jgi:hypothetical protein
MSVDWSRFDRVRERPVYQRNLARRKRVWDAEAKVYKYAPWMRSRFMRLLYVVWISPIDEGFREVFTPRWGAITFSFLNDGMKPTLWHTLLSLTSRHEGIYPDGAPTFRQWLKDKDGSARG